MPNQTFYLSDDLADKVKQRKGQVNISQVCSAALRREIDRLEKAEKGLEGMDALVVKWREQKETAVDRWEAVGRQHADEWIKRADYGEMKRWGEWEPPMGEWQFYNSHPGWQPIFALPEDVQEALDESIEDEKRTGSNFYDDFDWGAYAEGWHSRVREVWKQVADQL